MKSALFAALLLAGSAAFAQTTTTTTPPPDATAPAAAQPDATAPTPSDSATSPTVMPDNTAPRTDNMGTPVISAPAQAPTGFNQAPGMNGVGGPYVDPSAAPTPTAAIGTYPPCSRTVTDHCTQTYERGVGRHPARHR